MSTVFALDVETKSTVEGHPEYALQPFRLAQGKAIVTSCAITGPGGYMVNQEAPCREWFRHELREMKRASRPVFCHNTVFDVAWLIGMVDNFDLVNSIDWQDTGLLAKWLVNSQMTEYRGFSWSLVGLCKHFMPDHPMLEEFVKMKGEDHEAGGEGSEQYWLERGALDATMTMDLAETLRELLPYEQRNGYLIEQNILAVTARSWNNGMKLNKAYIDTLPGKIEKELIRISKTLPIVGKQITSPKQLSEYLFVQLGLKPINRGKATKAQPAGAGSTAADDLKMLRLNAGKTETGKLLDGILGYKQIATMKTKYVNGFYRVMDHVGDSIMHPSPRVFGTYTGRFTYGSKTLKKQEFQFAIACHQLPKKGPIKKCIEVPEDKWIIKCDGAQQELRIIAVVAKEENLIKEFQAGIDVHSSMSAFIANTDYDTFMDYIAKDDPVAVNYRYAGKLLNLSCQYRIGAAALQRKFFGTYGIVISRNEAFFYLNLYKQRYPGVVDFWSDVVLETIACGYATSLAHRRYYIDEFSHNRWQSESSAINEPIQGSAADHKELTLKLMSQKYPEVEFFLDVHDELCFYTPRDMELVKSFAHDIYYLTDEYRKAWDIDIPIELPFDTILCKENFKEGELILPD